jgi:hypothetical protein
MTTKTITINRAPVLTLWGTVVAERLGYDEPAALTLGQAVASLNARSKGRKLGIYQEQEHAGHAEQERVTAEELSRVEICGRSVPVRTTEHGIRAVLAGRAIHPAAVRRYLEERFGDDLPAAKRAMRKLAESLPPRELASRAFRLYEHFRPVIPKGRRGWGAAGELDLGAIERLAHEKRGKTRK